MPSLLHDARAEQQLLVSVTTYHSLLDKWGVEHLYDTTPYPFILAHHAQSRGRGGFATGSEVESAITYSTLRMSGPGSKPAVISALTSGLLLTLWMILSLVVLAFPTMLRMVNERLQSHVQQRRN
jgi:hypothetical protein